MGRALEELVSEELDTLYRGALFLCAGDGTMAEVLLERTVVAAHREGPRSTSPLPSHPLEQRMIGEFLKGVSDEVGPWPRSARRPDARTIPALTTEGLHRAAAAVPPMPRAVLWLTLVRRWPYRDVSVATGLDDDGLREALAYRDTFMAAALRRSSGLGRRAAE